MLRSRLCAALLLAAALPGPMAQARGTAPVSAPLTPEQQLVDAIELARYGQPLAGLDALERLLRAQPNFRLAHLVYADLLAARSGRKVTQAEDSDPRVKELFEEARVRLEQSRFAPPEESAPSAVLHLSSEYPYLVLVDLRRSRLYLMHNLDGQLRMVGSRYAAIGRAGYGKQAEGDLRTPVGVYHVTGWMGDESLPELYGTGALPLNYPNLWDRHKSKTGYGIWLHGVPRQTYVRAPRSSEGCVTMANDDLLWLKTFVQGKRAPVVLSDDLEWVSARAADEERQVFTARIDDWRRAWASRDTDSYLAFYGEDFRTGGIGRAEFARHKYKVAKGKTSVDIRVEDLSLFRYPGEDMLLAEFKLDYSSNNYQFSARKEQFWRRDADGQWRIFREENR